MRTLIASCIFIALVGSLSFTSPNKWLYRTDRQEYFSGFDEERVPRYVDNSHRSLFYFDGKSLRMLDRASRSCHAIVIDDKATVNSTSPNQFPFVVDSETLQSKYWIRAVATPPKDTDVWIEFWPRRSADQSIFSRLLVVLDAIRSSPGD